MEEDLRIRKCDQCGSLNEVVDGGPEFTNLCRTCYDECYKCDFCGSLHRLRPGGYELGFWNWCEACYHKEHTKYLSNRREENCRKRKMLEAGGDQDDRGYSDESSEVGNLDPAEEVIQPERKGKAQAKARSPASGSVA